MKHTIKNIINIKDIYLWTYYITLFAIKTFLLSSCLLVTYPLFLHKPIVPLRLVNYLGIYLFFYSYVGSLAAQSLIIYTKSALHCRFMWESRTFMKINNRQLTAETWTIWKWIFTWTHHPEFASAHKEAHSLSFTLAWWRGQKETLLFCCCAGSFVCITHSGIHLQQAISEG